MMHMLEHACRPRDLRPHAQQACKVDGSNELKGRFSVGGFELAPRISYQMCSYFIVSTLPDVTVTPPQSPQCSTHPSIPLAWPQTRLKHAWGKNLMGTPSSSSSGHAIELQATSTVPQLQDNMTCQSTHDT